MVVGEYRGMVGGVGVDFRFMLFRFWDFGWDNSSKRHIVQITICAISLSFRKFEIVFL